jgi:hypothetical protein
MQKLSLSYLVVTCTLLLLVPIVLAADQTVNRIISQRRPRSASGPRSVSRNESMEVS